MDEELIGREDEQAQLESWVTEALAGRGSLVLLGGEAGVGKTTLVQHSLASSGLQVLEGFAVEGGTPPFGPVVEALRSYLRSVGLPLLEGPLASHLAMLLPELGTPDAAADRATLFEAIRQALVTIAARRPTAVFLDDLQWADDATPELLGALARSVDCYPLLLLHEALTLARRIELAAMEMVATWGLAIVDQIDGAPDAAAGHCWSMLERWKQTEDRHFVLSPLRWATTCFAESGDIAGARSCAAALAQVAEDAGHNDAMSALSHALGETALLDGAAEQAAGHFTRALVLLSGMDAPIDRAESERRAAAALIMLDRREEAVEHLISAHRTLRRLGARPLVERINASLAELGERAERRLSRRALAHAANGSLSRREIEVVRLVAMGHTSREIARELFLSPRTVESHVSSILLKLDCRSRADAARRASELGLLGAS